jgi:hypothetical protein
MPGKAPRGPTSEAKVQAPGRVCQDNITDGEKVRTTIYLDATLHRLARERELNVSDIAESALRGLLAIDGKLDSLRDSLTRKTAEVIAIQAEVGRLEKQRLTALTEAEREKAIKQHNAEEAAKGELRAKQDIAAKINELHPGYLYLHDLGKKPLEKYSIRELRVIKAKLETAARKEAKR